MYFGNSEQFSLRQGLIFEARVRWAVLPTTGTETVQTVVGVAGTHNVVYDSIDVGAWFRVESAAKTVLLWETDDTTTNDDDNTCSGVTLATGTWIILRIDATDYTSVRFYVDGVHMGSGNMSDLTAAEAQVQPYISIAKTKSSENTGTGTLYVDYVRMWQNRE